MTPFAHNPNMQQVGQLAKLARSIAMDLFPFEDILKTNQLSADERERVRENPDFTRLLTGYLHEWNSAENTAQRIRVKSQTAVEALLENIVADCLNPNHPLSQRMDAVRQLVRLGELEQKDKADIGGGGSSGVSITINVGGGSAPVTIDALPVSVEDA